MPRNYKPRNRYCRFTKLSEPVFLELLQAFCDDQNAAQASRNVGVTSRTAEKMYQRFRNRLRADYSLSGDIGVAVNNIPEDHEDWHQLHYCLIRCPGVWSEEYYRSSVHLRNLRFPEKLNYTERAKHKQREANRRHKLEKAALHAIIDQRCSICPLRNESEFPEHFIQNVLNKRLKHAGIPKVRFRDYFCELSVRSEMTIEGGKLGHRKNQGEFYNSFVKSLSEVPL